MTATKLQRSRRLTAPVTMIDEGPLSVLIPLQRSRRLTAPVTLTTLAEEQNVSKLQRSRRLTAPVTVLAGDPPLSRHHRFNGAGA